MEQVFTYIGCFFSRDAVFRAVENISSERLERVIAHPHVTFVYAPRQVDTSLFGLPVYARVTGYGNDGKNEGLRVELFTADPDLQRLAGAIPLPHITLSVARGGHSVDTAGLTFSTVPPFLLEGRFGGMRSDGRVITTPQP